MATITEQPLVFAGDVITVAGTEYYITKVNPANFRAKRVKDGENFNVPRRSRFTKDVNRVLTDAERVTLGLGGGYTAKASLREGRFDGFTAGTVVRVTRPVNNKKWTYHPEQLFVVMKHNFDLVNIARLGGDGDRYWRMSPESLEIQKEYS